LLRGLPPGRHAVGSNLYVVVTDSGARHWIMRLRIKGGRRRELGLGSLRDVSIEEARATAAELRRAAREGRDPGVERRARRAKKFNYTQAFDAYFVVKQRALGNAKHLKQWRATMEAYVFPKIGERPVAEIRSGEIIDVLEPIWHDKPETAHRILQRMKAVFDWAIARNWREGTSPCVGVAQALGGTRNRVPRHHRALPYEEVPAFVAALRIGTANAATRLALEWLILTAARSGATRGATWAEMDAGRAEWVIPGGRLKRASRDNPEFRVPLSPRCLEILDEARALNGGGDLVFPSPHTGRTLSDSALSRPLRNLGYGERATPHGFRSSFRDWTTEKYKAREVVAEAALAHSVRNRTEAAYRRAQYIEERRVLMRRWADFVHGKAEPSCGAAGEVDVVSPDRERRPPMVMPMAGEGYIMKQPSEQVSPIKQRGEFEVMPKPPSKPQKVLDRNWPRKNEVLKRRPPVDSTAVAPAHLDQLWPTPLDDDEMMTVEEVAEFFKHKRTWVYVERHKGNLPEGKRIGGIRLFYKRQIMEARKRMMTASPRKLNFQSKA
jgi:integrase